MSYLTRMFRAAGIVGGLVLGLIMAGAASSGAAAPGAPAARAAARFGPRPALTPISHIIVLMQENHSFDSELGFWCRQHRTRCAGFPGASNTRGRDNRDTGRGDRQGA